MGQHVAGIGIAEPRCQREGLDRLAVHMRLKRDVVLRIERWCARIVGIGRWRAGAGRVDRRSRRVERDRRVVRAAHRDGDRRGGAHAERVAHGVGEGIRVRLSDAAALEGTARIVGVGAVQPHRQEGARGQRHPFAGREGRAVDERHLQPVAVRIGIGTVAVVDHHVAGDRPIGEGGDRIVPRDGSVVAADDRDREGGRIETSFTVGDAVGDRGRARLARHQKEEIGSRIERVVAVREHHEAAARRAGHGPADIALRVLDEGDRERVAVRVGIGVAAACVPRQHVAGDARPAVVGLARIVYSDRRGVGDLEDDRRLREGVVGIGGPDPHLVPALAPGLRIAYLAGIRGRRSGDEPRTCVDREPVRRGANDGVAQLGIVDVLEALRRIDRIDRPAVEAALEIVERAGDDRRRVVLRLDGDERRRGVRGALAVAHRDADGAHAFGRVLVVGREAQRLQSAHVGRQAGLACKRDARPVVGNLRVDPRRQRFGDEEPVAVLGIRVQDRRAGQDVIVDILEIAAAAKDERRAALPLDPGRGEVGAVFRDLLLVEIEGRRVVLGHHLHAHARRRTEDVAFLQPHRDQPRDVAGILGIVDEAHRRDDARQILVVLAGRLARGEDANPDRAVVYRAHVRGDALDVGRHLDAQRVALLRVRQRDENLANRLAAAVDDGDVVVGDRDAQPVRLAEGRDEQPVGRVAAVGIEQGVGVRAVALDRQVDAGARVREPLFVRHHEREVQHAAPGLEVEVAVFERAQKRGRIGIGDRAAVGIDQRDRAGLGIEGHVEKPAADGDVLERPAARQVDDAVADPDRVHALDEVAGDDDLDARDVVLRVFDERVRRTDRRRHLAVRIEDRVIDAGSGRSVQVDDG